MRKLSFLFLVLATLHVSGAYADECQFISGGGGNTNYVNDNMYCDDYDIYGIQYQGYTQVAYYDCTSCENGVTPVYTEIDGWSDLCGGVYAGSCHECDYDSQCGTDGWEYTAPGTEKYKEWSCSGHYCHWEYTSMRCDTGYEPGNGACEKAPSCSAEYSCSGTNWHNYHDLSACASYSTFCFDLDDGTGPVEQQLFNCDSCKDGYTAVTRYYDPDISGCDTYSYTDCECQQSDSDWTYDSSNHRYVKTVVDRWCVATEIYECAEGYYDTSGSCTACPSVCGVSSGSSRGSTSESDCCIDDTSGSDFRGSYTLQATCAS